jgi:hypothetical protein
MAATNLQDEVTSLEGALTKYVHPAELETITCTELDLLQRSLGKLRRELTFVGQDLARIKIHGKRPIYLLDYSELHSYVWPEQSKTQNRTLIRTLFDESQLEFALPPGALMELLYKLSEQLHIKEKVQTRIERKLANPFTQAFLRAKIELPKLNAEFDRALSSARVLDSRLSRLSDLFESKRLRFLTDVIEPSEIGFDKNLLLDIYSRFNSYRPGKDEIVNWIDAHNYATAYYLNDSLYRSKNLFFLTVTSSPLIYSTFESIKWDNDPDYSATPHYVLKTSLVRHPVHLLYLTYLLKSEKSSETIDQGCDDIDWIHKKWVSVPAFRNYLKTKDSPRARLKLPKSRMYLRKITRFWSLYTDVFRPLGQLLAGEMAQEENRRRLRGIESTAIGEAYLFDEAEIGRKPSGSPELNASYRSTISLFDRILNITQKEITRGLTEVRKYTPSIFGEVDVKRIFHEPKLLRISMDESSNPICLKIYFDEKPQSTYVFGEKYSDYTSLWWKTNVNFGEFMKAVRYYMRKSADLTDTAKPLKSKEFSGIYFYTAHGAKHFELGHEIDNISTDSLLQLCPFSDVRTICLALPFCDFYYDLEGIEGELPEIALVSHCLHPDITSDFVQWTNWKYAHRSQIRSALSRTLKSDQHK